MTDYEKAMAEFRVVSATYRAARERHHAKQISDAEFLEIRRWMAEAGERVDAAEDAECAIGERLEYLRQELRAERISYDELHELQSLASHIDADDTELLEAAGVPEGGAR